MGITDGSQLAEQAEKNETLSLLSSAANSINKAKLFALWVSLAAKKSPPPFPFYGCQGFMCNSSSGGRLFRALYMCL